MLVNVISATLVNLNLINNIINSYIIAENEQGWSLFPQNIYIRMTDSHLVNQLAGGSEQLILSQTSFEATVYFTNITMNGGGLRIIIESPSYSMIAIEHLIANNTSDDIYIHNSWDFWKFENHRRSVMLSYSHFTNYKLSIEKNKGRPSANENEKSMIILSHIQIKKSHYPLQWINVNIVLTNAKIINNYGNFQLTLQAVVLRIEGLLLFQQNSGGIELVPHDDDGNAGSGCVLSIKSGSRVVFKDNTVNNQKIGSVLYARNSRIIVDNATIDFDGNHGVVSGGMTLFNSSFSIEEKSEANFSYNRGSTGGAIAFSERSKLLLFDSTIHLYFIENHASKFGGAIFVHDNDYIIRTRFHTFYGEFFKSHTMKAPSFTFSNNTAQLSGSALYGGWIDALDAPADFALRHLLNTAEDLSLVSSDATRICMCISSIPRCEPDYSYTTVSTIPGQTNTIQLVAVGQRFGTVVSSVQAQFTTNSDGAEDISELAGKEYVQEVGTTCTNVSLTIMSLKSTEQLKLVPVNYNSYAIGILKIALNQSRMTYKVSNTEIFFKDFEINFNLEECPWGFYLNSTLKVCSCAHTLQVLGINCNFELYKVLRPTPRWIGAAHYHTYPFNTTGFLIHVHCPFDYCEVSDIPIPLSLDNLDTQCALNRSGTLCGKCPVNLSQVLGTSKCMECHKPWIALIIPLTAIAGFILVVFLIFLNLTVSIGTINGLIFYANVVRANNAVFFPSQISNSFLSKFIAWLNLDLGVETCFYDGFDAYAKTWFQFLFPLYIWLLVAVIIIVSHYSTMASRLSGNNAVQVLATLFLLSYAKLLRIIITIFTTTELVYPGGYHRRVWLYDGNIDYFKGKHIPLCVAGLITLIFISMPYTTALICVQWLQRYSSYKALFLVRKFYPLIDAYTGPYETKHRYWTGLLLLVRVCLFLVFALNPYDDPTPVNLLVIFVTSLSLLTYLSLIKGVYRLHWLNWIENIFLINLSILSATVDLYRHSTDTTVSKISYASTGTAFIFFVIIVLYHLFIKLMSYGRVRALWTTIVESFQRFNCQ